MTHISKTERILALSLIALGIALRLWIRLPTDLWEDEIIAATHSAQPFWQVILNSIRNDVHPPLYFLQLHIWGWLGRSDIWLTLNSVAWSLAGIYSIWRVGTLLYGARAGLFAAACLAILPVATYNADQLRMYAFLGVLLTWSFYLNVRVFGEGRRTPGLLIGHAALLIAIVSTHAIAALAVFFNGLYALHLVRGRRPLRNGLFAWLGIYGIAGLYAVPWLVAGMLHDANIGDGGGFGEFLLAIATTAIGNIAFGSPFYIAAGVSIFLTLCALGLLTARTRALTLIHLISPLLLSTLVTLLLKPIYKWNFFSAMEAPFIALTLALLLDQPPARRALRILVMPLLVAALTAVNIATRLTVHITSHFRDAANLIAANYRPGDVIFVPQPSIFWGMAWDLAGPDWGSTFAIAAKPSPQWLSVYRKLGPRIVEALHLMPDTQVLEKNGYRIVVGTESADQTADARRIWLVTLPRADLPRDYPPPALNGLTLQWQDKYQIWTTLYAPTPQQAVIPKRLDY